MIEQFLVFHDGLSPASRFLVDLFIYKSVAGLISRWVGEEIKMFVISPIIKLVQGWLKAVERRLARKLREQNQRARASQLVS